ncbi:MAG: hypothetical protein FJ405_15045 [Verrucomicrobia bacterium]|nr:hypothetical protein [Verrucomicrobiota bacterium]
MNFLIDVPGKFTSVTGRFDIQIRAGRVASASASGIYAGKAPPVGTPVPLAMDIPDQVEFDYDLSSLTPAGNEVDVEIEMYGSGEAVDANAWDDVELSLTTATPTGEPGLTVSWPKTTSPVVLESSRSLDGNSWTPMLNIPHDYFGLNFVKIPGTRASEFFRLTSIPEEPCVLLIEQQPSSVTINAGELATFMVGAVGKPMPGNFQWQRKDSAGGFVDIPGANAPMLAFDPGSEPFTNIVVLTYRCVVGNECTTVTSAEATLTILPRKDTLPPKVVAVLAACPNPIVTVRFSEPIAPPSALQPSAYQFMMGNRPGPRVLEARMVGPDQVQLFLGGTVQPGIMALVVNGVRDLAGNAISPGKPIPVQCDEPAAAVVIRTQ